METGARLPLGTIYFARRAGSVSCHPFSAVAIARFRFTRLRTQKFTNHSHIRVFEQQRMGHSLPDEKRFMNTPSVAIQSIPRYNALVRVYKLH